MIGKLVFISSFALLVFLTEIRCQKVSVESVQAIRNGSRICDFSRKHNKVIDPKKLNITWYNQQNLHGTSYSLDVASKKLKENSIFWKYPVLNIYVSGYGFSSRTVDSTMFRDAFLSREKPIMLIDFSAYSGTSDPGYVEAALSLYNIGEAVSKFLIDLVKAGLNRENIHLMGLSLGGQLVGNIARAFQRNYGANVGKVTALEPAGPCFDQAAKEESIKKEDADFVEIYNLNRGQLGTFQILGHANILINGGGPKQDACERLPLFNMIPVFGMQCAHAISTIAFWEQAITDTTADFVAIQCDNLDQALRAACEGNEYEAGLYTSPSTRGIFYMYFDYSVSLTFMQAGLTELLSVVHDSIDHDYIGPSTVLHNFVWH